VPDEPEVAFPDVPLECAIAQDLGAKSKPGPKESQSGERDGEFFSRRREQRQLRVLSINHLARLEIDGER
jgi:hypothetical protein